jgi:small subunit ribosomal protein S2
VQAIIDCNSFYCSCERLFAPTLQNAPIVVLSNNDGCIVSRSDEAKKLGIPVVGIVDSNNSPERIDYIIPGNDDSIRAVKLYCESVSAAVMESKATVLGMSAKADDFVEEAVTE